jgi:ABC-2 type transport system ATP-binding protein
MTLAIEIEQLGKSFGEVHALRGVDLAVPFGSVLGLLGANGAGKTTIVRILATLMRPDSGRALICGRDVAQSPALVRRRIGLAGQYPALHAEMTGREGLEHLGRLCRLGKRGARERAAELLDQFNLTSAGDRLAGTYSGGMRRRLDLASALVLRPPVLLLDEPTVGLDPAARLSLWDVIRDLVASGTSVLLTTQYLEEADELADRIVLINGGQVVASGTPEQLKDRIGGDKLDVTVDRASLGAAVAAVEDLSGAPVVTHPETGQVSLAIGSNGARMVADVVRRLDAAGVGIESVTVRRPSLDDVFMAIAMKAPEKEKEPTRG